MSRRKRPAYNIKFHAYKRRNPGWDFLPQMESYSMYGRRDYDYKKFYSVCLALRAFRYAASVTINRKTFWGETQ